LKTLSIRLSPGVDLKREIAGFVVANGVEAGVVLSSVGSLEQANLRFAENSEATLLDGPFEIIGMTGTLSYDGVHLHIALADSNGKTVGGHLMEGSHVHTTCELVVGVVEDVKYERKVDPNTGYNELVIKNRSNWG
jgi:predicted DNA-binding protein with PD1-like motif